MIVNLINLDRDKQRLERFLRLNAHLPKIERPPAIEGKRLDRQELQRIGYISSDLSYNNACLGNAHSHIELWRKSVESGEVVTIAEDDAIFALHFVCTSEAVLQQLPPDWDIVLWGWNFDAFLWVEIPEGVAKCKIECNQSDLRQNIEHFRTTKGNHAPVRLRHSFGLMAYTISSSGAKALIDICLPLRNTLVTFHGFGVSLPNRTLDAMMSQAYPKLKAYVCIPPLVVSENRHETSNTRLDP